jgi:putative FmdB family regulatory protein
VPIYEYQCDECSASYEVFQKMSDDPFEVCERCGGRLRKVLHPVAIHFKGSGFYTTDYGRGSGRRGGAREGAADGDTSPNGDKPEAKSDAKNDAPGPAGAKADKPAGTATKT